MPDKLLPNTDGTRPMGRVKDRTFEQNNKMLEKARLLFDSLSMFREQRKRCKRYVFGKQLEDITENPFCPGTQITEREYMRQRGLDPLTMNIIRKEVKALLGIYRSNDNEPLAVARDRDEQKLGEMMTIALQYAYQTNHIREKNTRGYEEFLISAVVCFRVGFDYNSERQTSDVTVNLCDINRMFWDNNTSGDYFENISIIGYLHDMTLGQVLEHFAKTPKEKQQIEKIYSSVREQYGYENQQFHRQYEQDIDFFLPQNRSMCRVFEIWNKEVYDTFLCHDPLTGEEYIIEIDHEQEIIDENNRRLQQQEEANIDPSDETLIKYEYKVTELWNVTYLTPNGYELLTMRTPYKHGSHPFTIGAYPLIDGETHSFVEDIIDPQRMINRLITRIEFTKMNAAKGFTVVNQTLLERSNVTLEEVAHAYASPSSIIALKWDNGEVPFIRSNDSVNSGDDVTMLNEYLQLVTEMTGVFGALRGANPSSAATPASLYAEQAQNANNNIADQQEWYNGLITKRDTKMMQVMQQYYEGKRYINIAGNDYAEESKWYDSDKIRNSAFDLSMNHTTATAAFRIQEEQLLQQLLQTGAIDVKTYLGASSAVFADKLLTQIKMREEEQQQQQMQQLMAQQQMQQQQTQQNPMANGTMQQQQ